MIDTIKVKPPLLVGLTGSIGSGKSAVAAILKGLGAHIIDADFLARQAVLPGSHCLDRVIQEFGSEFLTAEGELNRKKMGNLVFRDPLARKRLEAIVHPEVRRLYIQAKELALKVKPSVIVYMVPLLFESGLDYSDLKKTIVVNARREECLKRVMERDGISRELAERKFSSQIAPEEKIKRANYVLDNNGDLITLEGRVRKLYGELLAL